VGQRDVLLREFRAGLDIVRTGHLEPPPHNAPVRRFFHGVALTLGVWRVMMKHPETRARYFKIVIPQAVITLLVAFLYVPGIEALPERVDDPETGFHFRLDKAGEWWGLLYGALCVVEWLVISLSRDFHDELSRRASILLDVPPEDAPEQPRVRLNLGWVFKKLKRRIHGGLIFVMGLPMLALLLFIPDIGDGLYAVAVVLWAAYWLATFTLGKTGHAWGEQVLPDPWFFRIWGTASREFVLLRWWLPRWFLGLWRKVTGVVVRPAALAEKIPYEAAGLMVVRALCSLPVVYLFIRPILPVAATYALKEHNLIAPPASVSATPVVAALPAHQKA